ncbi:MAG: hypothetical protein JW809_03830 [Pirellulales bacterium]|nr:hypothetical protein [Pirellulales bacterium]
MKPHRILLGLLLGGLLPVVSSAAGDWTFKRSYYSHDPATGSRVARYSRGATPYATPEPNYKQSAYRHQRIRQGGSNGSVDNIHIVETWGDGEFIRPYGEWLYPYRAGATPYGPWGNPQGPWTTPFGSWVNPYGLGQLPHPPWPHWPGYSGYGYPPYYPAPPVPTPPPTGP